MTQEEAFEKLELEVGASQQEIQAQYQEFYNEFQIRITNAPTTHQKTLYQKKLKQLEAAYTLLTGKDTEDVDADLPWASPGETAGPSQGSSFGQSHKNALTKTAALQLLGLQEPFTKGKLEDAYQTKKKQCEAAIKSAFDEDMAQGARKTLTKIENAYKLLLPLAEVPAPKAQASSGTASKPTKKTPKLLWVGLVVLVLAGALLVLKPWEKTIDPAVQQEFTTLKVEANLLAKQKNWQEALSKYQAAALLLPDAAVQDSVVSIKTRLEAQAKIADDKAWEKAKGSNTLKSYKAYRTAYPNGLHTQAAEKAIAKIDAYIKSEAGRKKIAAEKAAAKKKAQEEQQRLADAERVRKKKAQEEQQRLAAEEKERKEKERLANLPSSIQRLQNSFVYVQGGSFAMGCTSEQDDCASNEKPVHRVSLNSFSIGKYEITQAQWQAVMGSNPSKFKNCDNCPVERVSWNEVQKFIKKLNQLTGQRFRLPTEAEWEYAARGGKRSRGYRYAGSNSPGTVAWYDSNSGYKTHPVGQKQANELGLYDMSGNVWEWCSDWYGRNYYGSSSSSNPSGPSTGTRKVLRGGSWNISAAYDRVSNRSYNSPSTQISSNGFRLVRY